MTTGTATLNIIQI
jgi:uncharacterized coiled-coil protein SlyX